MFDTELKFFIANQPKLFQQYPEKVLVLQGEAVVGVYDDSLSAYLESKKKFAPGSFMIQSCFAGSDAYTVSISSANRIFDLP